MLRSFSGSALLGCQSCGLECVSVSLASQKICEVVMKYFRALVSSPLYAFAILTLFFTASVAAQTDSQGAGAGTDLRFHKFQPSVAPENALPAAAPQANPDTITQQQVLSLEQDMASRTPAQQKID